MEGQEETLAFASEVSAQAVVLGGFRIRTADGHELTPRGRKARCILAYLLVDERHSASRDKLIGMLWSTRGEEQARGSLRQSLAEIRRHLGPTGQRLIEIGRHEVSIARERVVCDIDQLPFSPGADPTWTGDLLDGLESIDPRFDDWLQIERARFHERWLRQLEQGLAEAVDGGLAPQIVAAATRLLDFEPTHEHAACMAMRANMMTGNRAEALRCYQRLEAALTEMLGTPPSEESRDLVEEIRQGRLRSGNGAAKQVPLAAQPEKALAFRAEPPKVVVLPLVNLSGNSANDYLSDGLSDELITCLSRFNELQVLSRHASFGFRGPDVELTRLHDVLGVRYALHGSFMKSAERIRLNIHISNTTNGHQVWGERFDLDFGDLLELMDHVVDRVRDSILPAVEQKEVARIQLVSTEHLPAYDHYLRGKYIYYAAHGPGYAKEALQHFERAVELDPHFTSAMIQLIRLYNTELFFSTAGGPLARYRARAFDLAERLLQIDTKNPNAHISMAWCQMWQRRFMFAEQHFEEALRLNPYEADRLNAIATGFMYLGRLEDALRLIVKAKGLATFDLDFFRTDFGEIHYLKREFETAQEYLEFAESRSVRPQLWRCATYGQLGLIEEARREGASLLRGIEQIWVGSEGAGAVQFLGWFFEFLPFARDEDENLLREGLRAGGLPA